MTPTACFPVGEPSQVSAARRAAAALASLAGFDDTAIGRVALVVTELGTNLVKHARAGRLVLRHLAADGEHGIEVLSVDRGPGMANPAECLRDGFSTAGSPGTGLGAVARAADVFDLHSTPGRGTVLLAQVWRRRGGAGGARARFQTGVAAVAYGGGEVSGDGWAVRELRDRCSVMVADGLGHGPDAAAAARAALAVFATAADGPAGTVHVVHQALRATRGAAVAVAEIRPALGVVAFCGVGNVGAAVVAPERTRALASHNGTAGVEARKIEELTYPWPRGATLVMHSDGVSARWELADTPGLALRHAGVIAGALLRDHGRDSDDATVAVVREVAASRVS